MKYLLFLILLISIVGKAEATMFHIVPAATSTPNGFIQNSFLAVQQTATATPTPGSVSFDGPGLNLGNNSITLNDNSIGYITSNGSPITTGAMSIFVTIGCTLGLTIQNFEIGGAVGVNLLDFSETTGNIMLDNLKVTYTGTSAALIFRSVTSGVKQVFLNRCNITSTGASAVRENALLTTANDFYVLNSKLSCPTGIAFNDNIAVSSNQVFVLENDTIYNSVIGMVGKSGMAVTNLYFFGNTTDYVGTAVGVTTQLAYSAFGQLPSGAGTSCIYGITIAREFCDQTNGYVSPAALGRNAGISITGVTNQPGLNGIRVDNACTPGSAAMGCCGYSPALCGGLGVGK